MEILIALISFIVGAGVMFFVYRNNAKVFAEKEAKLNAEIEGLKKKFDIIRGK